MRDGVPPFLHHVTGAVRPRPGEGLKAPQLLPRVLTVTEAQAILDACGHLRDRLLLRNAAESGLRIGEVLGMRHEDIDIGRRLSRGPEGQRERHAGPSAAGDGRSRRERR